MNDHLYEDHPFFPPLRILRFVGLVILGVVSAAAFALAFGWFVMLLWNWLMPPIFGLGLISYWQAFGLVVLAKLVFGALGGGRHAHPRRDWRRSPGSRRGPEHWRYWREFWEQEGRQAFDRFVDRRQAGGPDKEPGDREGPGQA